MEIVYRMRFHRTIVSVSGLLIAITLHAQTQPAGPSLVATYVETAPAKTAALNRDLHAYAAELQDNASKPKVTILKEEGRPGRMLVIEQWQDLANAANERAEVELAAKAQAEATAPIDRRSNHAITPELTKATDASFYVVTHLDVNLNMANGLTKILAAQRDAAIAAPGAQGYEVSMQDGHPNHFTIYETWTSRAAHDAYAATPAAEDFRKQIGPLLGSPLDDRFYTVARFQPAH